MKKSIKLSVHKLDFTEDIPSRYLSDKWYFGLLEEKDLDYVSDLAASCFYKPGVKINDDNMSGFEKWISEKFVNFSTSFEKFDHRFGAFIGFKSRSAGRLRNPNLQMSSDSFILTACDRDSNEIIGLVEICLEAPDGKLAPPIQGPWKQPPKANYQPYLCNLCVSSSARRQGLGKLLCVISEQIVLKHWKKNMMFLHVEQDNLPAQLLYVGLKYETMPIFQTYWESKMNGMENLLYFQKNIRLLDDNVESIKDRRNIDSDMR